MKYLFSIISCCFVFNLLQAQCLEDRHSPFQAQGWQSCQTSVGPIADRGDRHWILYDFGEKYVIDSLYFWNYNVWGETGIGVKELQIDYSTDQVNWTSAGTYTIEKAPGSWKYEGTGGPNLGGIPARYMLFTVLSTWDASAVCTGLAEVKFELGLSTDVEEIEPEIVWSVSPNPATNQITVELPQHTELLDLSLYNSVGVLLQKISLPNTGAKVNVEIEQLQSGVYYIACQTKDGVESKSFVKI